MLKEQKRTSIDLKKPKRLPRKRNKEQKKDQPKDKSQQRVCKEDPRPGEKD